MYYNTSCQFSCNNGYIGSGSQVRRCQQNGNWSGQDFTCQIINCTSLTVNQSSPLRMSSCDNHYGSICNFSCAIGHRLNGSSAVVCLAPGNQHPGVWNDTTPTCEVITCPALFAPSNGTRLGCSGNAAMNYDTTCQFSCNNGYIGSGSQVRRCQHSGTWSGQDFTCQIINCTSLTVNPSGVLRMSSCDNHYGAECNFSCAIGHRLNGSSTVTCVAPGDQHPGMWNKAIPTCEASLTTMEESVLLEVKDMDVKKWNKQTEDDFKIEVARLATVYCDAEGTRCQLIPASSRGKRSSNNLIFSKDRVHILPGYPKQLSEDPLIAQLAFYLQFPQAVSDDIVLKDVLIAIMESNVSSIAVSINGTILSVRPLFSKTQTTEESDEESKPTTAIIIGVCVGVLLLVIIIVAVVLACKRSNSSKKSADLNSYNNTAYVGNADYHITSEGQVTEMKNIEFYSL
ncbi:P-selectin-like [Oculina patagonica]